MNKNIKLSFICDKDGKFLRVRNTSFMSVADLSLLLHNKRLFNLVHSNDVVSFINDFRAFLTSKNNFIYIDTIVNLSNDFYGATFKLKKKKNVVCVRVYENLSVSFKDKKVLSNFFFITRVKFVIGSLIPFLFAVVWTLYKYQTTSYYLCCLIFLGLFFFHIAANTFNDYFDWVSGRDSKNTDYVLSTSGGSRAIDFKLISTKNMYAISLICVFIVFIIGLYLSIIIGYKIFILGFSAFLCVYFYSAPPIHLASRYGAGELMHIICLGPMITYGTVLTLISNADIVDFIIGFPFGILITCCLLMNEYPDSKADKSCMKNNLAVVLTKNFLPEVVTVLSCLTFLLIFYLIQINELPKTSYIVFIILYYFYIHIKDVFAIKQNDNLISNVCIGSFNLYIYTSILLIFSIIIAILNPW